MKTLWRLILVLIFAILYIGYAHPDWIVDPAWAINTNNKDDGECQPNAVVGRCADKCPNQTDILQGYQVDTGIAICLPQAPQLANPQPQSDNQVVVPSFVGK